MINYKIYFILLLKIYKRDILFKIIKIKNYAKTFIIIHKIKIIIY
jgi:hypothetical protein